MEDLGEIGVTYSVAETRAELLTVLSKIEQFLDCTDDPREQIVIIIPASLRERLGWRSNAIPQPAVFNEDLVFRPPV